MDQRPIVWRIEPGCTGLWILTRPGHPAEAFHSPHLAVANAWAMAQEGDADIELRLVEGDGSARVTCPWTSGSRPAPRGDRDRPGARREPVV